MICQGNGSYASGTAANEGGLEVTSPTYFDGLRLVLGSVAGSNYAANNAVQKEQGVLNLTQTIKSGLTQVGQQGGMPDVVVCTMNAKEILDQENENNKRWADNTVEAVPGIQVNQLIWANGTAKVIAVPGFSFGTYVSPLSGQTVEDVYFFNTDEVELPWLYAPGITTLELPAAVDYTLSQRYICFSIGSLAIKGQPFAGKVRRLAS